MVYHASSAVICRDLSVYEDVARTWIILPRAVLRGWSICNTNRRTIIAEAYTEAVLTPAEWSDASVQAEQRLEVHSGKACLWMDVPSVALHKPHHSHESHVRLTC